MNLIALLKLKCHVSASDTVHSPTNIQIPKLSGEGLVTCSGNNSENFKLHALAINENIARSFGRGLLFRLNGMHEHNSETRFRSLFLL